MMGDERITLRLRTAGLDVSVQTSSTTGANPSWLLGFANAIVGPAETTVVAVTMGRPSERAFTLSGVSNLRAGEVAFDVTNRRAAPHRFKVCTKAGASRCAANAGVSTRLLASGESQRVVVTLEQGAYALVGTQDGRTKTGMKSLLRVKPSPEPTVDLPRLYVPPTLTCNKPAATTVTVDLTDAAFSLSQSTIPCGTVTFVERNLGTLEHSFSITGQHTGALLPPGATATVTATLPPGGFITVCDVRAHFTLHAPGSLTVLPS